MHAHCTYPTVPFLHAPSLLYVPILLTVCTNLTVCTLTWNAGRVEEQEDVELFIGGAAVCQRPERPPHRAQGLQGALHPLHQAQQRAAGQGALLRAHYLQLTSLLTADYSPPTTHYSLLTIHYSLLTTHYSPLTTPYSPVTTHFSLFAAHCPRLTAACCLLTAACSLLSLTLTVYLLLRSMQHTAYNCLLTTYHWPFTTCYRRSPQAWCLTSCAARVSSRRCG